MREINGGGGADLKENPRNALSSSTGEFHNTIVA